MAVLKEQVPKPLRTPVGVLSYAVGLLGVVVGYILVLLGTTLYFDLHGLGEQISDLEALTVLALGVGALLVGYFGVKGFMYFSY